VYGQWTYLDLNQHPQNNRKIKLILDGAVRGAIAQVVGNISGTAENVKVRTYPGRKFTYEYTLGGQQLKSDVEVYLIGKRMYSLSTTFKQAKYQPSLSKKYFETFNPFDPQDSELAAGNTGDGMVDDSEGDAQGSAYDGLSLPSGVEPLELK